MSMPSIPVLNVKESEQSSAYGPAYLKIDHFEDGFWRIEVGQLDGSRRAYFSPEEWDLIRQSIAAHSEP